MSASHVAVSNFSWASASQVNSFHVVVIVQSISLVPLFRRYMDCRKFLCSWNSPGKNTGGGCHFLLQEIFPPRIKPGYPVLQADSEPLGIVISDLKNKAE